MNIWSLTQALPEIVLCLGAMALLMLGAYAKNAVRAVNICAILLLIAAAAIAAIIPNGRLFGSSFILDDFARFLKILAFTGSAFAIVLSFDYLKAEREEKFEYSVLILLSTVGMGMLISAGDLIALYIGLELMSLALYVVAASSRDNVRSTEAGLKYFVLGALSSGMLLYGCSLIYGFTGNVSFAGIAKASTSGGIGLVFGLVFLFAGFCFKVSAVPFHMWTPDVYEGAPTPVTAFFAAAPKVAAIAIFCRATITAFPGITHQWQQIVVFVSIASMALGAFAAIGQRNIKRLMAYSSIGHMGFALIGLAAGTAEGIQGVLVYMSIYLAMTVGAFAVILAMRRPEGMVEQISDLAGLARSNPPLAFFLALLLFSLAGIPPLAGFFAKYYVFLGAIKAGLYALAVIGVLTSVVGAYYYLLIVKIMYFDEPAPRFEPRSGRAEGGAGHRRPVQPVLLHLSGAADRGGCGRREIAVLMRLDLAAETAGARLIIHDTIGSTNEEALRLARAGERGPLWLTAKQQTAGRGRRGRTWVSEPGNLYASLLLTDPSPPERYPALSFVAALALHDAVAGRIPGLAARVALKWPNDLLIDRNKFAGILVEGEGAAVAIGIGVNCLHHPFGTDYPATDLATAGLRTSPESVFAPLTTALATRLAQWNRGEGFAAIRSDWLARAGGVGKPVRVKTTEGEIDGQFEGIDQTGRLLLRRGDAVEALAAGDVFMPAR